jgi:DNA-directed RNA polymerase sigma subunit (sigma70/sigma32)
MKVLNPEGGRELTYEEIGQELGCTGERVRQLEVKALAKCKALLEERGYDLKDLLVGETCRKRFRPEPEEG